MSGIKILTGHTLLYRQRGVSPQRPTRLHVGSAILSGMTAVSSNTPEASYTAVSMLRSLLHFLEHQGLGAQQLAHDAGLSDDLLAQHVRLVSSRYYAALMQAGMAETGNPLLGLEFGMAVEPDRWGMLGVLLTHCTNVAEEIAFQSRFQALVSTIGHARLVSSRDALALNWETSEPGIPALTEEALAAWVCFGRWATGQHAAPRAVTFRHPPQGDPAVYTAFFGCPVYFEQAFDGLSLSPEILHVPLRNPDAHLKDWLIQRAQRLQHELLDQDIRARLAHWFADQLPFGVPSLAQAADDLGFTERTLQRQLHASGTTFKDCMTDVRIDLADYYLRDASVSIGDIGFLLGFSEQSAFQRAFKRWEAMTPRAYRRQLSNSCDAKAAKCRPLLTRLQPRRAIHGPNTSTGSDTVLDVKRSHRYLTPACLTPA